VPRRYRPILVRAPLTFAQPLIPSAPASLLLIQNPRAALPAVRLASVSPVVHGSAAEVSWTPVYDLFESGADDAEFVAEIDDDGRAHLRFGDGRYGRAVEVGMTFSATYRAGNGRAGLVGAETIVHAWFRSGTNDLFELVRNPLPSSGALEPEPVADVKMRAPIAFRKDLQRAITADDYATLAKYLRFPERNPRVQNAAGSLIWSGSWYEADVAVDPFGSATLGDMLRGSITGSLERYRRMGHDLRVGGAQLVPLRLELDLCIKPDYLRAHVLAAVREAVLRLFQPDNTTFGEAVYISRIVAAVMAVDGVLEVDVKRLERLADVAKGVAPESGILKLKPFEIARLDNDPAIPENGILAFGNVRGGR
jgi:predicted phage baseplate assembly protein